MARRYFFLNFWLILPLMRYWRSFFPMGESRGCSHEMTQIPTALAPMAYPATTQKPLYSRQHRADNFEGACTCLVEQLQPLLAPFFGKSLCICGVGNRDLEFDSLGPETAKRIRPHMLFFWLNTNILSIQLSFGLFIREQFWHIYL